MFLTMILLLPSVILRASLVCHNMLLRFIQVATYYYILVARNVGICKEESLIYVSAFSFSS